MTDVITGQWAVKTTGSLRLSCEATRNMYNIIPLKPENNRVIGYCCSNLQSRVWFRAPTEMNFILIKLNNAVTTAQKIVRLLHKDQLVNAV
jgi:hypothetical protein